MKVAINGAGIAGAALAYWLARQGHEVVLVEQAPGMRTGGYVLNLWGVGFDAAERMGLLPRLLELQHPSDELRMVDSMGRTRGGYPSQALVTLAKGRIISIARADIAASIHDILDPGVEKLFGDSIAAIEDHASGVRISFDHAPPREVDLVVGADGLHSRIRRIMFGPDERHEHTLGCHVASFEVAGYRPREERVYVAHTAPGRYVARFPVRDDKTLFFVLMRDEHLAGTTPRTDSERRAALSVALGDMGWECPAILAALETAKGIYMDTISQVRMDAWSKGRVALVGDAAACPSLIAGTGAGFAMAQAYVLAGEMARSPGNLARALASYQGRLQGFVARKQGYAEGLVGSFVPRTRLGVRARDAATLLMRLPGFPRLLMGRYLRDTMHLPDYVM
jgi:2-polyprenyl-6-methoxyphenol hydroxylase-like FAD-dependent oxidoreductase